MTDLPRYSYAIDWVPMRPDMSLWGLRCPGCRTLQPVDPFPETRADRDTALAEFAQRHATCLSATPAG